jgi:hypothetical protein
VTMGESSKRQSSGLGAFLKNSSWVWVRCFAPAPCGLLAKLSYCSADDNTIFGFCIGMLLVRSLRIWMGVYDR